MCWNYLIDSITEQKHKQQIQQHPPKQQALARARGRGEGPARPDLGFGLGPGPGFWGPCEARAALGSVRPYGPWNLTARGALGPWGPEVALRLVAWATEALGT